ncbi:kinase-like protein [Pleurotus eryngii]|uniref:Kinase-like protein n=1 Tax=Pleurotus eryngii TaxID=5323 RepID=A0A9P5ZWE3_PLEER|nr:kinase-like protein [Pleurotus eryngii]
MQYLAKNPEADLILLLKGIGNALLYLHEEGVIHGDLRPGIISICDNGEAAIHDFGRSKRVGRKGSTTYTRGTCRYSAPEAWSERSTSALTAASDVYSFGLVALHILSGTMPFVAEATDAAIQRRVRAGRMPTVQEHSKVTADHWRIIERCWGYKERDRPEMFEVVALL